MKNCSQRLVLSAVLWMLMAGAGARGEEAGDMPTVGSPLKVLFIGNSLTFYNDLPGMVKYLAGRAVPPLPVEVESVTIAGASLGKHWEDGEALKAIRRGGWDCVVLQGHSMEAVTDREGFFKHVRLFDAGIKEGGADTMLYMTWALRKAPEDQQGLTEAYHEIGKETGARVVPVGVARESLLKLKPDAPIYHRDGKHPTPQGTYLAACLFHAMLSGRSPAGLPAEVPDAAKPEKALVLLNPEDAALYQDIAGKAANAETGK